MKNQTPVKIKAPLRDIEIAGVGNLDTIVRHYNALPILIEALKKHGDTETLDKWDKAR